MHQMDDRDKHQLEAAEGWLELGNWREANEELERIAAARRAHPDVLAVRFRVYEAAGKWDLAIEAAGALCKLKPNDGLPCVYLARSLNGLGNTKAAVDFLVEAADHFPDEHRIQYDLACYCCALGQLEAAGEWLKRALEAGDSELKVTALEDLRLDAMWAGLGKVK